MGNTKHVDRASVPTGKRLRILLRAGRKASGNLTQRAAAKLAGISPIYWQRIESGNLPSVPADTLASMFLVTGISPVRLRGEGYPEVASALDDLAALRSAEVSAEDHLAATPGATAEEVSALQAVWIALRGGRTNDPVEQDFEEHERRHNEDRE